MFQDAHALDFEAQLVAALEPDRGRAKGTHPGRRASRNHIARLERHETRDVFDQGVDREDHVGGTRMLHPLAVEPARELERLRIYIRSMDDDQPPR
jgi:hypothetical protein